MSKPRVSELFAQRAFIRFWLARLGGVTANQMLMVAVAWHMYDITSSAWDLGLVGLLQFIPALLFTLPAGHVADRHHRGRIFAACLLVQAAVETGDVLTEAPALTPTVEADPWEQSGDEADTPVAETWTAGTIEPDADWADAAEQAVLQELNDPPQGAAPYQPQDADEIVLNEADAGEVPVDEAMLREIVRDVLREELQGRLGERITRNIRKLVRAEIARVMATEDFL